MSSIKERDPVSLSQRSLSVKGFIYALQLVMVEAVPALLETPQSISEFESEGELEAEMERDKDGDKEADKERRNGKPSLSPGHARKLNKNPEVVVDFIIPDDGETELDESTLVWSDDETDHKVANIVSLVNDDDFAFTKDMFTGGINKEMLDRLKKEKKEKGVKEKEERERKANKKVVEKGKHVDKRSGDSAVSLAPDTNQEDLVSLLALKVNEVVSHLEEKIGKAFEKIDGRCVYN